MSTRTFQWMLLPVFAMALALGLSSCRHKEPNFIYMPDMVYQPAVKAQSALPRLPVAGTVPRTYGAYLPIEQVTKEKAGTLQNPEPRTREAFLRGQHVFNNTCIVCHGPNGEGDGFIVPKFPRPPSLQSDKVRNWKDGDIFYVITKGQNLMASYATQLSPQERWDAILYVRALQRSKHPTPEDLKAFEQEGK